MTKSLAAVIGDPVSHSLSPKLFELLGRRMGRGIDYRAVRVEPDALEKAVARAGSDGWLGWNVTLPHKVEIMAYLDEIDPEAREIGAVNVVRFSRDGCIGYNTDAEGFLEPLKRMGFSPKGRRAAILGSGGAAKAARHALGRCEAGEVRTVSRRAGNWSDSAIREAVAGADLVVQATPLGMDGRTSPLPEGVPWKQGALAYDLIYSPLETPFLRQAGKAGARTLGGLGMLVAQAAATWRLWFDEAVAQADAEAVEKELRRTLS